MWLIAAGAQQGPPLLSRVLTLSTLDLIGNSRSRLICSLSLPTEATLTLWPCRAVAGSATPGREDYAVSVMIQNELWSVYPEDGAGPHSWLISGVHLRQRLPKLWSAWRQATPDLRGYGLLLIWLKLLGLRRKRKLSTFISITAGDDKTQIGPWHWLLG